jgi:hypothetical protein
MKLAKPSLYRLTLSAHAFNLVVRLKPASRLFGGVALNRPDGKIDIGISRCGLDQLQTLAKPGENLSDTLIRIWGK